MVVRDTTGETPFPNQSGFTSFYTERYFMFITDGGEICKIDIQAGGGTYERNLAGTFGPDHGVHPVDHTICTYMTRSADGGLHLGGCTGVRTTYDIPHP